MKDHELSIKALTVIDSTQALHQYGALEKYIDLAIKRIKSVSYQFILAQALELKFNELVVSEAV